MLARDLKISTFFLGDRGSALIAFRVLLEFAHFYVSSFYCTMAAETVEDAKISLLNIVKTLL